MDSVWRALVRLLAVTLMVVLASPGLTASGLPFPRPAKDLMLEFRPPGRLPQQEVLRAPRRSKGMSPLPAHLQTSTTTNRAAFPDTIPVFSTEDTTRHLCSYNGAMAGNELTLDVIEKLTAGKWDITSRYTCTTLHATTSDTYIYVYETWQEGGIETVRITVVITLDSTHFYRSETHELGKNGELKNDSRQLDSSDTEGLNASRVSQTWENDRWLNQTRSSTTTDSTKTRLVMLSEEWQGGAWVNVRRATQAYGSAWPDWGYTMTSELDEVWVDGEWVYDYRVTSTTQTAPRTYQEMSEQWVDGVWTKTYRVTDFLDDQGRETAVMYELWNATQWAFYWKMTWTFDPRGAVACTSTFHAENGSWIEDDRTTSSYDRDGHLVGVLLQRNAVGQMANVERYTYTYDTLGRCVEGSHDIAQGASWFPWDGDFDYQVANSFQIHGYRFWMIYPPPYPTSVARDDREIKQYALLQNYPNPFNPNSEIRYHLPALSMAERQAGISEFRMVRLSVYDLLGREVAVLVNERKEPGSYTVHFNASGLASGVYLYRLSAGGFVQTRKMLLMK